MSAYSKAESVEEGARLVRALIAASYQTAARRIWVDLRDRVDQLGMELGVTDEDEEQRRRARAGAA